MNNFLDTAARYKMTYPNQELIILDINVDGKDDYGASIISLDPQKTAISAKTRTTTAIIDGEEEKELKQMGISIEAQVHSKLFQQHEILIHKELIKMYNVLGTKNRISLLSKRQKFISKIFKNLEFPFYVDAKKLDTKIMLLSNYIALTSRRGAANFCVVNPKTAMILEDLPSFIYKIDNGIEHTHGINYIGHIGSIKIYVNLYQKMSDSNVLLGRIIQQGEPGVVYGEHSERIFVAEVVGLDNIRKKVFLDIKSAIEPVGNVPEASYFRERILIEKKPLWRKLCKI